MDDAHGMDASLSLSFAIAYAMALHQMDNPVVLADPLTKRIVGLTDDALAANLPGGTDFRSEMRLDLAMSYRFADDVVAAALARDDVAQLIILDAGLDTTSYRRPYPRWRLFEVDSRGEQTWKRQRMFDAGIPVPPGLRYVPLDADRALGPGLAEAGYDAGEPTLVVWLKTVFRTPHEVEQTREWLGAHRGPLELVTDYNQHPPAVPNATNQDVYTLVATMDKIDHPWISFSTRERIQSTLRAAGLDVVEDLSWADRVARYVPAQSTVPDTLGAHIVRAVRPPE